MADHSHHETSSQPTPDYELADVLSLEAAQIKLLLNPLRLRIIDLLSERAATTSQLADVLDRPKGTIGHHCKAMERAGLIRVVRTRKVRAIEERYYGRTARLFLMPELEESGVSFGHVLDDSLAELKAAAMPPLDPNEAHLATVRYARIPTERAQEWADRLAALGDEFAAQERGGSQTYGVLLSVFATDRAGFT